MVLKNMKLAVVFIFLLFGVVNAFAADEGAATAKQVVEKFKPTLLQ